MDKIDRKDIKSESVRTSTSTKNGVKTTITERTITTHDGRTFTFKEETTGGGGHGGAPALIMGGSSPRSGGGSSGQPAAAPVDLKTFRDQALKSHNELRAKHGSPPMKYSQALNDYAQKWAEHLIKTGSFQHSNCTLNGERIGENIASRTGGGPYTGDQATAQWYSEISRVQSYSQEPPGPGTGHFTQVVWKSSTELGIGKAEDGKGKTIVVGSYKPPGNFGGHYTQNVFPPK